jgi:hypothetical protein
MAERHQQRTLDRALETHQQRGAGLGRQVDDEAGGGEMRFALGNPYRNGLGDCGRRHERCADRGQRHTGAR